MAKKPSLLEQATQVLPKKVLTKAPDKERLELDLAFMTGKITAMQYSGALGRSDSQAYHAVAASLRKACQAGLITIIVN